MRYERPSQQKESLLANFPGIGRAISKQPVTARLSDHGRCFSGAMRLGFKDFCGADEIDG